MTLLKATQLVLLPTAPTRGLPLRHVAAFYLASTYLHPPSFIPTHLSIVVSPSHAALYALLQGERALDFVLSNRGMIDKTLLFDIELLRIL